MSEITKPVEEPVAAPATTETPVVEPVTETAPVETEAAPASEPAATEPAATEAKAEEAAPAEVKPVEEGALTLKGPSFIKSLIGSKKFFWFGSEPVTDLPTRGRDAFSHENVAWASHTGKGLLFYSKTSAEKTPAGIINLSDIKEITNDGSKALHFTENSSGHKYTLVAESTAERDGWFKALETRSTEAKAEASSVTEHEDYKSKLASLKTPVVPAAATPKKSTEVKKEEKTEAKEEKKEEKAEAKDEDKKRTSRSASRKRLSIFGTKGSSSAAPESTPEEAAPTTEEAATTETPAAAAAEPVPATEETAATEEQRPAGPSKRNSVFDHIKSFTGKKEKKPETESAPAVPAKDAAEPVSETAPVIPAVEATEPLAASTLSPATVPADATTNGETKAETETPVAAKEKRKSSLAFLSGSKKEKATSGDEAEKPKSPFSNIGGTIKKKFAPKAKTPTSETAPATEAPAAETETPAVTEPVAAEPVASEKVEEPVSTAPAATPTVAATA